MDIFKNINYVVILVVTKALQPPHSDQSNLVGLYLSIYLPINNWANAGEAS